MKVAFLTTVFLENEQYLNDFFLSLQNQTYKKFDVIVVNDGFTDFKYIKEIYSPTLNLIELQHQNTPAKNREFGINFCIDNNYDILIFGDSDDFFSNNRIETSISLLKVYDIIVNDLTILSDNKIDDIKYISNRIKNLQKINIDFIKNKNIFGFTNTAINLTKLKMDVSFEKDIIATDWYFYSKLLIDDLKSVFTCNAHTFYRQHTNSLIGLGKLSEKVIQTSIEVKLNHYKKLNWVEHFEVIKRIKLADRSKLIRAYMLNRLYKPLWWEEIRLIAL